VFEQLQAVLQALGKEQDLNYSSSFRMADFADFACKILKTAGYFESGKKIFEKLTRSQQEFALEDEPLVELIGYWLEDGANAKKDVDARKLFEELKGIAKNKEFDWKCNSPRALGQKLVHLRSNLEQVFKFESKPASGNRKVYALGKKNDEN
jgi:hypothetical protein